MSYSAGLTNIGLAQEMIDLSYFVSYPDHQTSPKNFGVRMVILVKRDLAYISWENLVFCLCIDGLTFFCD